ncbi:hypothetical protein TRVL_02610 [Trypanosoma vivax]|nr:hypothetical protein TRVL_02610 [Trypanosoma vivax]
MSGFTIKHGDATSTVIRTNLSKSLIFKFPASDALIPRLYLLLILGCNVVRISAKSVPRVDSVHLTQRPISPFQKALAGCNTTFNSLLLLKAFGCYYAFNQCILWSPADAFAFLFHC